LVAEKIELKKRKLRTSRQSHFFFFCGFHLLK